MDISIVEYFSSHSGYKCGYCRSTDTCYSHGMWTHSLQPIDYQNLIDRGWRRSGKYCYKPTLNLTCCPLYAIRCEAKKVLPTRSQKKVLKKVHKFLAYGDKGKLSRACSENVAEENMEVSRYPVEIDMQSVQKLKKMKFIKSPDIKDDKCETVCDTLSSHDSPKAKSHSTSVQSPLSSPNQPACSSVSPKPSDSSNNISHCRKAKDIRRERKLQKLLKNGMSEEDAKASIKKNPCDPKSIEDFLTQPLPSKPAHKLELRLVPVDSQEFEDSVEESHEVYVKYQTSIHKDTLEECDREGFEDFLVETPLQTADSSSDCTTYGSYHQHYLLDGKIIAVGVLDILPYCISSVYFFYDPDYSFLSLGTYAALREIVLVRELNKQYPDLQYYYMGFYIHSCIKMVYKAQFVPSHLLCPETYIFQGIEKCKPKLDISKYHRLEDDPCKEDTDGVVDLKEVIILYKKTKMTYPIYKSLNKNANDEEMVKEYANFVGRKCFRKLLLYRDSEL